MNSGELIFKISLDYPEILEKIMAEYNQCHGTDFEIIDIIYDEITFCKIKVTRYTFSDIFDLGGAFGVQLCILSQKGELKFHHLS